MSRLRGLTRLGALVYLFVVGTVAAYVTASLSTGLFALVFGATMVLTVLYHLVTGTPPSTSDPPWSWVFRLWQWLVQLGRFVMFGDTDFAWTPLGVTNPGATEAR